MSEGKNDYTLSNDQRLALTCVLDHVIPASGDGRLPGAGELGLESYIRENATESFPILVQGLAALDQLAVERGVSGFVTLSPDGRIDMLGKVDAREPAFLPTLIFHTYIGYYQDARVIKALGLVPGPPFPGGYEVAPTDLSILDSVRRRPKFYRE
jgi:hypothetical protein